MNNQEITNAVETIEQFINLKGTLTKEVYQTANMHFKQATEAVYAFLSSKFVETREEFKDIPTIGLMYGKRVNVRCMGEYSLFTYKEFSAFLEELLKQDAAYF